MKKVINVRMEPKTIAKLDELAEELGLTRSDLMRLAAKAFLNREHDNHDWIEKVRKGATQ